MSTSRHVDGRADYYRVSLLIPTMTIHLKEVQSSDRLAKAWSHNRLDFCLLVLKHLERNYPAATLVHELFVHARDKNSVPFGISGSHHATQNTTDQIRDDSGSRNIKNDHMSLDTSSSNHHPPIQQTQLSHEMMDDAMGFLFVDDSTWPLFPMEFDAF